MRTIVAFAVVTLLLMLLSGLSLLGMNPEASRYDRLIAVLSRFAITESALRQDILNARVGLVRTYDPLNREMLTLHNLLGQLRKEGADPAVVGPMEDLIAIQNKLTERFKTNNALLQNSLSYFGLMSGHFGVVVQDGPLASAMTALSTAMLRLTLDTSPDASAEVANQLDQFAKTAEAAGETELVAGILVHGRLLHEILPATDEILENLYDLPRDQRLEALRASVLAQQKQSRAQARYYRGLLYATSILLLGLLVYFGMQLRGYVRALRRQAALERAIAAISMGFVNAPTEAIGRRVDAALATLAERVDADRAYFIVSIDPPQTRTWSRDSTIWPPGWPAHAPEIAARAADNEGVVYLPSVESMPNGSDKNLLRSHGLLGWMCVSAYGPNANRGLLGFDFIRAGITRAPSDRGLLRMAADTIANAVGHASIERDRARLESSLQQVRRMETVGAMASGVAHNFNNIIGVILGYTEMEESYAESDSRLARNLEGIRHAAERARDLIDKILTFGRRKESPRQVVSIRSLMAETQSLLSVSFPRRARLVVVPVPDEANVCGDPIQLQQVIMNLCNNAVQAMDGVGVVRVETHIQTIEEARSLTHGGLAPGRYVCIAVQDTGRGIDPQALGRLFEPFFTTRAEGNGLGLATVREIVRSHDGVINVWSRPAEGTIFSVWIPLLVGQRVRSDSAPAIPGNGETVLILDEDRAGLLRHEEIVAALGYEPVGFAEPDQVLRAVGTSRRQFDALLIGNLVPTVRALAFAAKLRGLAPELPILMTASADDVDADVLSRAGVSEVVGKPLHSAELAAALSRRLTGPAMIQRGGTAEAEKHTIEQ